MYVNNICCENKILYEVMYDMNVTLTSVHLHSGKVGVISTTI